MKNKENLPPVIRIFVSSTFADMSKERNYFNTILVPKFSRMCTERGISFFCVDLRWGITAEEQLNGNVLPICLREIDRCRPFFIGILGNRYGSIMKNFSGNMLEKFPWLQGKEGKSITELEMLYGVLDVPQGQKTTNSAFYFRSAHLSKQWFNKEEKKENSEKLKKLKQRICNSEQMYSVYNSIEEFDKYVTEKFSFWLQQEFSEIQNIKELRKNWYEKEFRQNYIETDMHEFLNYYIENETNPLLIYGEESNGKTAFLTNWQPFKGEKILINCDSDNSFLYWPEVINEIVTKIQGIDEDYKIPKIECSATMGVWLMQKIHEECKEIFSENSLEKTNKRLPSTIYYVTDKEIYLFRMTILKWLKNLKLKSDMVICINDINQPWESDNGIFTWLPAQLPKGLHIICTTNNKDMLKNAKIFEWNCTKMKDLTKNQAERFLKNILYNYGKNLDYNQIEQVLKSKISVYSGPLKFFAKFLILYGTFENLDLLIAGIQDILSFQELYQYVYQYMMSTMTKREQELFIILLGILRCSKISLQEQECYEIVGRIKEFSVMEWGKTRICAEQFQIVQGDYWNMKNKTLRVFTDIILEKSLLQKIQKVLGDFFMELLMKKEMLIEMDTIHENTEYSKAVLEHYRNAKEWDRLEDALMNYKILYYLSKLEWKVERAAWMDLLRYSEKDIPEVLFQVLENVKNDGKNFGIMEDKKQMMIKIAALFEELELKNYIDKAKKISGLSKIDNFLYSVESSLYSMKFNFTYNRLLELEKQKKFRELYEVLKIILIKRENWNDNEILRFLELKCKCEFELRFMESYVKTCDDYYIYAIKSADYLELRDALLNRGKALYSLERFEEAKELFCIGKENAVREGDIRAYLSSLNQEGLCYYHMEQFEKANLIFQECYNIWMKLKNFHEVALIIMNQCNIMVAIRNFKDAYKELNKAYEILPLKEKEDKLGISILYNMSLYEILLKNYESAEKRLLNIWKKAKMMQLEAKKYDIMRALAKLYEGNNKNLKSAKILDKMIEFLFRRGEYHEAFRIMQKESELLLKGHYLAKERELRKKWEDILGQLSLEEERLPMDNIKIKRIEQEIIMTKGKKELYEQARLQKELFDELWKGDKVEAIQVLYKAADSYKKAGDIDNQQECLREIIIRIFKEDMVFKNNILDKVSKQLKNKDEIYVVKIWKNFYNNKNMKKRIKNWKIKNIIEEKEKQKRIRNLIYLSEMVKNNVQLAETCILELHEYIIKDCSKNEIQQIFGNLEGTNTFKNMRDIMEQCFVRNNSKDMEELKREHSSLKAEKIIMYYEKGIQILQMLKSIEAAMVAGNLALIFRRKRQEGKTFYYHRLSAKIYQQEGKIRDCLIEKMNLSTAYSDFFRMDQAILLLREVLEEAEKYQEYELRASIAGNLASVLVRNENNERDEEEILYCFEIEETYFKKHEEYRELAISLINQIIFFQNNSERYYGDMYEKIVQLKRIINEYRLFEFLEPLQHIERKLKLKEFIQENVKYILNLKEIDEDFNIEE